MTVSKVIRDVASDTLLEAAKVHVEPYHLVSIVTTGGTLYYSDGQETVFGGNTYIVSGVKVDPMTWSGTGKQTGSITLMNDDMNIEIAIILSTGVADAPVKVWKTYRTGVGTYTTPVLMLDGFLDSSEITPEEVRITILSSNSTTVFVPNRYFTKDEGFNFVPKPGSTVTVANDVFLFEAAD